jgi:hypothetical protein
MMARLHFNSCSFSFCHLGFNKLAHAIAAVHKLGVCGIDLLWADDVHMR